jgi:hypothetical protein
MKTLTKLKPHLTFLKTNQMKTKLNNLIYYFTPLNDEHKDILSTSIAFVLFWAGVYTLSYITNL